MGSPPVVLISASLSRRLFGGRDPIGLRVHFGDARLGDHEIIGVVGDVADARSRTHSLGAMYAPFAQDPAGLAILALRSPRPQSDGLAAIGAIHEIDPDVVVDHPATMLRVLVEVRSGAALVTWLCGVMGVIALVLAALGIYGLVSYSV